MRRDLVILGMILPSVASAADDPVSSGAWGGMAAAIAVPLVLAWLRKSKIYRKDPSDATSSLQTDGVFRKWDGIAGLLMLVYAGVVGVVCWFFFTSIESLVAKTLGPAEFVLTPSPIFFALPAIFSGLLLSPIPLRWTLTSILGKDGVRNLIDYTDRKQGINSERIFRHMVYLMAPIVVVTVLLAWRTYATVTTSGVTIHPYFSLSAKSITWGSVRKVSLVKSFTAPDGSVRREQYYVIEGENEDGINFHNSPLEVTFFEQEKIAEYVAEHAGLQIDVVDPYPVR